MRKLYDSFFRLVVLVISLLFGVSYAFVGIEVGTDDFNSDGFNQMRKTRLFEQGFPSLGASVREGIKMYAIVGWTIAVSSLALMIFTFKDYWRLKRLTSDSPNWAASVISQLPSLIILEGESERGGSNCPYYSSCLKTGGCHIQQQIAGQEDSIHNLRASNIKGCEFGFIDKVRVTKRIIPNSSKILTIVDDVSSEYEQRAALEQAHELAEQAVQSRERFLATMSHELRTPIASMIGLLELLSFENSNIADDYKIKSLMSSAKNLQLLVNDILDYSKLDSQGITLVEDYVSYTDLLGDLVRLHEASARERGLVFETEWSNNNIEHILIDDLRLGQVVNNVLSNAVKFTEQGKIKVSVALTEHEIKISVNDTGIGISADKLESIFDPFRQADDSIERQYGGTGLGLAIVKKLITLMSGYISIESAEGEGTNVTVSLPIKSYKHKTTKICFNYIGSNASIKNWFTSCADKDNCIKIVDSLSEISAHDDKEKFILINNDRTGMGFNNESGIWEISTEPFYPDLFYKCKEKISTSMGGFRKDGVHTLSGLRVLIAEDNPINQYMLSEQMDLLEINAVIVSNGIEAKNELQKNGEDYDMLITDVHMPKMDGISLVRWVRETLSSFKYKPILGCTAEHSKSLRAKMLEFDDVILKPFEVKKLFDVISSNRSKYKISKGRSNNKIASYISTLSTDKRRRLQNIFCETMTSDLSLLKSAIDEEVIRKIAHKIKGGSNSIGEFEIGDVAELLESKCLESKPIEEVIESKGILVRILSNRLQEIGYSDV
ncbi:ATP-binding response regulator [Vibrio nomapromontoriensis]|uniref:hybrid sensor histidine kinase/response regulator n=1 Tax=Vibrio nomapromontoriensis TaxID=2910246 RepID=UPI003D0A8CF8